MYRPYRLILGILIVVGLCFGPIVSPVASAQFGSAEQSAKDNFEDGVVACAATAAMLYALSLIPGIAVPSTDAPNTVKDTVMDCVFWAFKNAIIQEVTGSTVQWVQTGMGGNPAFVQNLGQYFRDVADRTAGMYIEEYAPFLCSPFRAEIQLQLTLMYQQARNGMPFENICTLTDAIENIDDFLDGNFAAGGWDGWLSMTLTPTNNYFGAYLHGRDELNARVSSAQGEAGMKLELSNGFFSKEVQECFATVNGAAVPISGPEERIEGASDYYCNAPKIVTPGSQIKTSLEQAFNLNLNNIASADEFNEIFSLLAVWLISDILTEDGGLAEYDPSKITHTLPDVFIPTGPSGGPGPEPVDSEPPGPPGPSACFVNNETFIPQRERVGHGNVFAKASFPLPQNVSYDVLTFEIDVKNTGWRPLEEQPPAPNGTRPWVYNIFYLPRIPGAHDTFGYVNVRSEEGPANYTNNLISQHGVGQGWEHKPSRVTTLRFPVGATYRFTYIYDTVRDIIEIVVVDKATGERVGGHQMTPDTESINIGNKRFAADIGFPTQSGNPYDTPSYGWEYSNLKVRFLSEGDEPETCSVVPISGAVSGSSGNPGTGGGGRPGEGGAPFNPDWPPPSDTPIGSGGGGGAGNLICMYEPWHPWCGGSQTEPGGPVAGGGFCATYPNTPGCGQFCINNPGFPGCGGSGAGTTVCAPGTYTWTLTCTEYTHSQQCTSSLPPLPGPGCTLSSTAH